MHSFLLISLFELMILGGGRRRETGERGGSEGLRYCGVCLCMRACVHACVCVEREQETIKRLGSTRDHGVTDKIASVICNTNAK